MFDFFWTVLGMAWDVVAGIFGFFWMLVTTVVGFVWAIFSPLVWPVIGPIAKPIIHEYQVSPFSLFFLSFIVFGISTWAINAYWNFQKTMKMSPDEYQEYRQAHVQEMTRQKQERTQQAYATSQQAAAYADDDADRWRQQQEDDDYYRWKDNFDSYYDDRR